MVTRMRIMSEALTDMSCVLGKWCGVAVRSLRVAQCCGGHGNRRSVSDRRSTRLVPSRGKSACEEKDDNRMSRSTTILLCKYGIGHDDAYSAEAEKRTERAVVQPRKELRRGNKNNLRVKPRTRIIRMKLRWLYGRIVYRRPPPFKFCIMTSSWTVVCEISSWNLLGTGRSRRLPCFKISAVVLSCGHVGKHFNKAPRRKG